MSSELKSINALRELRNNMEKTGRSITGIKNKVKNLNLERTDVKNKINRNIFGINNLKKKKDLINLRDSNQKNLNEVIQGNVAEGENPLYQQRWRRVRRSN